MSWSADSGAAELVPARTIPVICGPTASGKSAVAMQLAERHRLTIISADSRQVYRRFDIGTAKPGAEERRRVPHRGIDVVEPTERYSAAAWAAAADAWIDDARAAGRAPVVVGGTGLYLRALFGGFFEEPELDVDRRQALQAYLGTLALPELQRWTRVLDAERAHLGRTQLLRAIEVALLSGCRMSALHRTHARPARHIARYLVLDPGAALEARIGARVEAMFAAGWVDEVESLIASVPAGAPAWKATGYGVVAALARGDTTVAAAKQAILVETRQYAKRQRTWFRHQLNEASVVRVDPASREAAVQVERWWTADEESVA